MENLERRALLAADFFVNDNWHFVSDTDASTTLTPGDLVDNSNDVAGAAVTATYGVDAYGEVTTGAFTGSLAPFDSIQDAIDDATPGDEVAVLEGTYNENLSVNADNLTLSGHTGVATDVVIDGGGSDVITVNADDVLIRHLRVTDGGEGIHVVSAGNFSADNVQADNNSGDGLDTDSISGLLTVTSSALFANQDGLDLIGGGASSTLSLSIVDASGNAARGLATGGWLGGISISDSSFDNNVSDGIGIFNGNGDVVFINVAAGGNDPGLFISGAASFSDTDGNYSDNDNHGIQLIDVAGDVTLTRTVAINNDADNDGIGDGLNATDGGDGDALAIGGDLIVAGATFSATGLGVQQNGLFVMGLDDATFAASGVVPMTVTGNSDDGVHIEGLSDASFTGGSYSSNGDDGVDLADFNGIAVLEALTLSDNSNRGFALVNAAVQGTLSLSDLTLLSNLAGVGGEINHVTAVSFAATTSPAATEDAVTLTSAQFRHTRAATLHQRVTYQNVTQLNISTLGGRDTVTVLSTAAGTVYDVSTGAQNDTIHLSDPTAGSRTLDGLLGSIAIDGGSHENAPGDPGHPPVTILGDTSGPLFVGDSLHINDQDDANSNTYNLSDGTFSRTGTAAVTYAGVETVNLNAAANQPSTINIASTVASGTTTINGGSGVDNVTVTTTGADSNVTINTDGGADDITIQNTGGDGGDGNNSAGNNALGSFVTVNAGDQRDTIAVWATALGSRTDIQGGAHNDTIHIGNPMPGSRTLDNLLGSVNIDGGAHENVAGDPTHPAVIILGDSSGALFVGDTLNINDQDDATPNNDYDLSAGGFSRVGVGGIAYASVETVNLNAAAGQPDTIDVAGTVAGGTTNIASGMGIDTVTLATTGADSNVAVNTGNAADLVTVQASGIDGGDPHNLAGNNALGSFLVIRGGDEPSPNGDRIVLEDNGGASRVQILGQQGRDTIEIWASELSSRTEVLGGDHNDILHIANPAPGSRTLDDIRGEIRANGENHEASPSSALGPINGDTNTLVVGDTLNFNDQDSASGNTYDLSASTFSRTGTAVVTYDTVETVNLSASLGSNTINVANTVASGTTSITGGIFADAVGVTTTGIDSNVSIETNGGTDIITIHNTGADGDANNLGSFLVASGGNEIAPSSDAITLRDNGTFSRVQIHGGDGQDTVSVWKTAANSATEIFGGNHNDTIHIGNPAAGSRTLDNILGGISVNGQAHETAPSDPTHAAVTINGQTNGPLFVGDTLHLNDQDDAHSNAYHLTAGDFSRTGTAVVTYLNVETVNLNAALAAAANNTINVASSVAGGTTTISSGAGTDDVTVTTTGADSNVTIDTVAGSDTIAIQNTGADGADANNSAGNNALGSFVTVNSGDGQDTIAVWATGPSSRTNIVAGAHNDTIHVGNPAAGSRTLDGILGLIRVDGEWQDVGAADPKHPAVTIKGDSSGQLFVGDTLHINDQDDASVNTYSLSDTDFSRTGTATVSYTATETINLNAAAGQPNSIDVAATAVGGTTTISGGTAADQVAVATTGADSNVTINTLGGADIVTITSTGTDGSDPYNASGNNALGSFLVVNGGDEVHPAGDHITLQSNGGSSRTELNGQQGDDTIEIWATSALSETVASGHEDDDTFLIANGDTDTLLVPPSVFGGELQEHATRNLRLGFQSENTVANYFVPQIVPGVSVADSMIVRDDLFASNASYSIDSNSVGRDGFDDVHYFELEVVRLNAGLANDDIVANMGPLPPISQFAIVQIDGGAAIAVSDNRVQIPGTSSADKISIGNLGAAEAAAFELTRVQRLWVRGEQGNDEIDNQSQTPGLLDGGKGNDIINNNLSSPPVGIVQPYSVLLGSEDPDRLFVGRLNAALDQGKSYLLGDYRINFNEQQRVGFTSGSSITGGSFTLTFNGQTTGAIPFNSSAGVVRAALESLPIIGVGDVSVTKVQQTSTAQIWKIMFQGTFAATNVLQTTINAGGVVTAGPKSVVQSTDGDGTSGPRAANPFRPLLAVNNGSGEPGDRYISSSSAAKHTMLALKDNQVGATKGRFAVIGGDSLRLTTINWLKAQLVVTQKQIVKLLGQINRQVAEYLKFPGAFPMGSLSLFTPSKISGEGEADDSVSAALASGVSNLFSNPFHNLDVNADGQVSPADALLIINDLNARGPRPLVTSQLPEGEESPIEQDKLWVFYDVNGDSFISASDALLVINALNAAASQAAQTALSAEGEADFGTDESSLSSAAKIAAEDAPDQDSSGSAADCPPVAADEANRVSCPTIAPRADADDDREALYALLASDWQQAGQTQRRRQIAFA